MNKATFTDLSTPVYRFSILFTAFHPGILYNNFAAPFPDIHVAGVLHHGSFLTALFFGYSGAILGVSGGNSD